MDSEALRSGRMWGGPCLWVKGSSGEKRSGLTDGSQSSSESSSEWEYSERGGGSSGEDGENGVSWGEDPEMGVGVQSWLRKAAALWESLRLYAWWERVTVLMGGGRYLELEVKMLGVSFIEECVTEEEEGLPFHGSRRPP